MSNQFGFIDIILLAMFAGFIILRLRNILGRKTGHQGKPIKDYFAKGMNVIKDIENNESIKSNNDSFNKIQSFHNKEKDWLFGYLSYDLKNELYDLSSKNIDNINVDNIAFFIPRHVFLINKNSLYIESIDHKQYHLCNYLPIFCYHFYNEISIFHLFFL